MKTKNFKNTIARGSFLGLTLAGTLLYSCGNKQQGHGTEPDAEANVPAVSPADSVNYGLNGREGGSDTIGVSGTATPPRSGDTISIGTGATGSSDGTTGGGSGTPNDKSNPHVPDNKQ